MLWQEDLSSLLYGCTVCKIMENYNNTKKEKKEQQKKVYRMV